ncbi:MAG: hypothetical protein JWL63_2862 [Rhodocyclales bacterium]|nr:hypothetical protein [Rhodocyclales bacterium]
MTGAEPKPAKNGATKKPLWRRVVRGLLWAFLILVILLGMLFGGLYWSVTSESGSRALVDALSRWSGGAVQVEGWQGRVYGKFQAKRLRLHLAAMDIDAERVALTWHPAALRLGTLSIDNLQIGRLEIRRPGSNEPARMPESLALPFRLHIVSFDIALLAMGERAAGKPLPPPSLLLNDIAGSVDSNAGSHRINRLALSVPAGRITGKGEIQLAAPYALTAQASFAGKLAQRVVAVDGKVSGSLDKLALSVKASGEGMSGNADVRLRPFAALPVESARIGLRGVDPSLFNAGAPHAALDVTANLTPQLPDKGTRATGKDPLQWQISGPVETINRKPATIDEGGLPIERFSAQLAWAAGALQLDAVQIALPGQGRIKGKVRWQMAAADPLGRIDADLSVQGVDPARLHTKMRPMQITGTVVGKSTPAGGKTAQNSAAQEQDFRVDLASGTYRLVAKGAQRGGALELEQATLTAGDARLEASGRWQWQAPQSAHGDSAQAFSAKGRIQRFDPRAFVQTAPAGNLNADFSAEGVLRPTWRAKLNLDVAASTLAGYPLQGRAALVAESGRVYDADIAADLLGNSLKLSGALGLPADRLQVQVDAPQLARLHAGLHGRVSAQGTVGGTLQEPFVSMTAQAGPLGRDGSVNIEALNAKLLVEPGAGGRVEGNIDLKGLSTDGNLASPVVRSANLSVAGKRDRHTLRLDAALMKDQTLTAAAEGGWRDGKSAGMSVGKGSGSGVDSADTRAVEGAWLGRLTQFVAQGPLALRLKNPADIRLSPQHVVLGEAALVADNGNVQLTTTEWTPLRTVARGRMTGLQIGFAVDEYQRTVMRGKSLQLGAEWDVTLAERANGLVRVFREGGDFILQGDAPVALGLETLELNLAAQEDRLAVSALISGKRVGAINFAGSAMASRHGSSIALDPDAPLTGVGHVEIPAIDWLGPVIDQNLRTGGRVTGDFSIVGTGAKPQGSGRIVGSDLTLALADQGLRLRDGQLELNFDAARVTLGKLDFRAERSLPPPDPRLRVLRLPGAEGATDNAGRISGSGGIDLKDGAGLFDLKVEHVPVLQRADQWVLVSGTAGIVSGWDHMDLTAKLRADAGFVGVPKSGAPVLGDDVLVRGRQPRPPQRMRVNADIDFDFGNNFIVKAWGIDTWLDGQLRVRLAQGQVPRATGALRTRDGIFDAYGQKLAIDRGLINFSGALDNPALNVVAMRKGLPVEAGVEVTGAVQRPRVRLVSDPEVPESEKLSWILLGRPSDAGTADAGLLISAASAAFGGDGPGIAQRVANSFGFDDVSVGQASATSRPLQSRVASNFTGSGSSSIAGGGTANEQVLTLGKRLSSKAYLALEQNLVGTESIIQLSYELTRYLSLIAHAGTDNGLDLHYEVSFR